MNHSITAPENNAWEDAEIIHAYSRADAIRDGALISVDETLSKQAGLNFPVALCRDVWDTYVDWTDADTKRQTHQDLKGRLWDILCMLKFAILLSKNVNDRLRFSLRVVPKGLNSKAKQAKLIHLWAHIHPGDELEPVITISSTPYLD